MPGCNGMWRSLPPLPCTRRCGTPRRRCTSCILRRREFFAPQPVVEQQGEEGAIAQGLQIVAGGELQEMPRLGIPERRRLAFVAFDLGPLHALDRIRRHRVLIAQDIQRGRRGRRACAAPSMPASSRRSRSLRQARTCARVTSRSSSGAAMPMKVMNSLQVVVVRPAGVRVVDVRKPLGRRRHLGELEKFGGGQRATRERDELRSQVFRGGGHAHLIVGYTANLYLTLIFL